jgi:predicted nucleotidyltransferase
MNSIYGLLAKLENHPNVVGLVEFGGDHWADHFKTGDYDLLVILAQIDVPLKSIHFYIEDIPVDLNLRTFDYIQEIDCFLGFERAFLDGRIIYDETTQLESILERIRQNSMLVAVDALSENEVSRTRQWHRHSLDKVKNRLETDPVFCNYLLNTNLHWLIENYFRVRCLEFRGATSVFRYLKENEPEIWCLINDFYGAITLDEKVVLTEKLTKIILQPIGGVWQDDEVVAFCFQDSVDLGRKAKKMYDFLLG